MKDQIEAQAREYYDNTWRVVSREGEIKFLVDFARSCAAAAVEAYKREATVEKVGFCHRCEGHSEAINTCHDCYVKEIRRGDMWQTRAEAQKNRADILESALREDCGPDWKVAMKLGSLSAALAAAERLLDEERSRRLELESLIRSDKYDVSALAQMYLAQCENIRESPDYKTVAMNLEAERARHKQTEERLGRITKAAAAMVDKLDRVHHDSRYISVWEIAQSHLGHYEGPKYVSEMEALRGEIVALPATPARAESHAFTCPKCGGHWFGTDSHTGVDIVSCHDQHGIRCGFTGLHSQYVKSAPASEGKPSQEDR